MAEKRTVYLRSDDLVRLKVARKELQRQYPMQNVSVSWVFRYALYALVKSLGLTNVESGPSVGGSDRNAG